MKNSYLSTKAHQSLVITLAVLAAMSLLGCHGIPGSGKGKGGSKAEIFNEALLSPAESDDLVPLRGSCFELGNDYILSGQLPQPDFGFAKENGVKTIINVRMDRELGGLGFEMEPHMKQLGLRFVHFPVGPDSIDDAQADSFVKLLTEAEKPLLINGSNGNRIWGLWALYLGSRWQVPVDRTKEVAKANGIKKLVIEEFVRDHLARKHGGKKN